MYQEDCDIIYSVAGGTGNGIIEAAKDYNRYVIGVDANQDHLAKGNVLTSMMKMLDVSVVDLCEKFLKKELIGNTIYEYGYKNGGVGITEMEYTKEKIDPKILEKVKEIEKLLIDGKIKVTNSYVPEKK
ncbi:MAG TPA: BMP family ABC transporter substrate-binding protein [Spirochaetota bacterium]|nr:BMP family ABC transporter substrate-binding protein [Spirochaetota bacterium]